MKVETFTGWETFPPGHGEQERLFLSCTPFSAGGCRGKRRGGSGFELQLPGAGFPHSFTQKQPGEREMPAARPEEG